MTTDTACPHNKVITCNDCRLSSLCLPLGFTQSELSEIDNIITQRPLLQKGDYLYRTHATFECIYVVRSGCIKTVMTTKLGEEKITGFYLPGDIVGIEGIGEDIYNNSAIALDTCSVCKIPFDHMESLAVKMPDLQRHIFKIMGREIVSDQHAMMILNKNKAEARIAGFLLSLSSRFQRQKLSSTQWALPMSRGDLGNYLGLTIESVSRVFTRLRKQGVIQINKREVIISNLAQLQILASIDSI
ncbi:MAG: CRP/FNR family transcriptional regulator [Candidatus Endobugula sp.]|jgi:CRP/FNR family transcriptional regulator